MARLQPFRSTDSSNRSGFTETFGTDLALSADGGLLAYSRLVRDFDFTENLERIDAEIVVKAADGAGFGITCPVAQDSCTYRYRSENDFERDGDQGQDLVFSVTDTIFGFNGGAGVVVGPVATGSFQHPPAIQAPALSADGTRLAFERGDQIVVVDLVPGLGATPWIASTAPRAPLPLDLEGGASGPSFDPSLSGAGDLVAFVSTAPDLLNAAGGAGPGKGKGKKASDGQVEGTQVLLKDLNTGALSIVSADQRGRPGDGPSGQPQVAGDGRLVVFESAAENLVRRDGNGVPDVFLKNLKSGRVTLLSADRRKDPGNGPSGEPSLALDGRFVAFTSSADDLVAGDFNGIADVFVKDVRSGRIQAASADPDGNLLGGSDASISGDGRFVVLLSDTDGFPAGDQRVTANAFVKDMTTGALARLEAGAVNTIANTVLELSLDTVEISADGSTIAFYEGFRSISIAGDATAEESAAAQIALAAQSGGDPQFASRDAVGVTTNPLLDVAGPDGSLRLDSPIFDLGKLVPGAKGPFGRTNEAFTLQDGGPAGLHVPFDYPLPF